jgi:hypothetical protein
MMGRFSFQEQRHLLEMAASSVSIEEVVRRTGRPPESIRKVALRLGISFNPKKGRARPLRGIKAKAK